MPIETILHVPSFTVKIKIPRYLLILKRYALQDQLNFIWHYNVNQPMNLGSFVN